MKKLLLGITFALCLCAVHAQSKVSKLPADSVEVRRVVETEYDIPAESLGSM